MKAELTPELKERFFALYWGQKVMKDKFRPDKLFMVQPHEAESDRTCLMIRTLDQITDEEAIEVAKIIWEKESEKDMHTAEEGRWYLIYRCKLDRKEHPALIDFLRSKGFAVPYMGHSVEELVDAGWIKLT